MSELSIIAACDNAGGIGYKGKLPWNIPEDLARFKELTMNSVLLMGRTTYEEIHAKFPGNTENLLPGRKSIVLSTNLKFKPVGAISCPDIGIALEFMSDIGGYPLVIIGGESLFNQEISKVDKVHLTMIDDVFTCDRFFPIKTVLNPDNFEEISRDIRDGFKFLEFKRIK